MSYRHRSGCVSGYRIARNNGRFSVAPNTSKSYDCDRCAIERIGRHLRGLYGSEQVGISFYNKQRVVLQRKARRHGQLLGLYAYEHTESLLAITTATILPSAVIMPVEGAIEFAQNQGVDLRVTGWSYNQHFPTLIDTPTGAEIGLWPSYIKRREQKEILKLLGWRVGRSNPQHDGIPIQHLFDQACAAYQIGELTSTWTCPIPITDGTEEYDDGTGDSESWDWDN